MRWDLARPLALFQARDDAARALIRRRSGNLLQLCHDRRRGTASAARKRRIMATFGMSLAA
jgi:hypothetical protein